MAKLKNLVNSLDTWELCQEKDKIKIYSNKLTEAGAPPLVRGDTTVVDLPPGCLPQDLISVTNLPGCRKIWDVGFDKAEVKEYYTRFESLFWVKLKFPWPISARDFTGSWIQENEADGTTYSSMISVQDPQLPATSGTVRGALLVSGWKFYWTSDKKIGITYVIQVDLAGSLPTNYLKKLFLMVPFCAGSVRDYVTKYGFAPSFRFVEEGVEFKKEEFDHDARKYKAELAVPSEVKGKGVEIVCCSRMYPKGVQVELKGGQGQVEQLLDEYKNPKIVLNNLKGSKITVVITKKK